MKKKDDTLYLVGDFETTVYEGQDKTEVWASGVCELYTEDAIIFHSIEETYDYLVELNRDIIIYYHNLKFDGSFWIYFFINQGLQQAIYDLPPKEILFKSVRQCAWIDKKKMKKNTYRYSISDMGQWYNIILKTSKGKLIEFRDSYKLLPFSLKRIGESFKTKHRKLEMEYEGYRYPGCYISPDEEEYLKNDLYVAKEALEIAFNQGHTKLTIGACCLSEFVTAYTVMSLRTMEDYRNDFPNLYEQKIDENLYGSESAGYYVHEAYRGGWCYLVRGKENKIFYNGTTADVNSLYPSMMSSESGNYYPIGKPSFWTGNKIPDKVIEGKYFYYVRIRCSFKIKDGMLPFIQIKRNPLYKSTEMLETSDIYDRKEKRYIHYIKENGEFKPITVTMTMTMMDYKLFLEHYDVENFEILDGCYFNTSYHIFDEYIDKYKKIKMESKGAVRELAKLFLNNLYGKMATSINSSFKVAHIGDEGGLQFETIPEFKKKPGYIAIGAAITSYARCFTIRAAQANYHGINERGFIYADTDSIHCDLEPNEIVGIKVDDRNFCCWKLESCWDFGQFTRQKTYIEHIVKENLLDIEKPYYNVKCAGMPEHCKQLFLHSVNKTYTSISVLSEKELQEYNKMDEEEKEFVMKERSIEDFKTGLMVPGKLVARQITGGTLLCKTTYEMMDV